jgi:hypothetical protein
VPGGWGAADGENEELGWGSNHDHEDICVYPVSSLHSLLWGDTPAVPSPDSRLLLFSGVYWKLTRLGSLTQLDSCEKQEISVRKGYRIELFSAEISTSFQSNCLLLAYLSENEKRLPSLRAA